MRLLHLYSAVVLTSALASCAAGPPPSEELTRARALVDQADKGLAGRYAAADLQRAHDELSAADAANRNSQYDVARRAAEAAAGMHPANGNARPLWKSALVPYLDEPWYCCAEPMDAQLVSIGKAEEAVAKADQYV